MLACFQISKKLDQIHNFYLGYFTENLQKTDKYVILIMNQQTRMTDWLVQSPCQWRVVKYIGIKLWVKCGIDIGLMDSRVLALVFASRVHTSASALALKGSGLGLGLDLESSGLGGPGLGLVLVLWMLTLTTTLLHRSIGLSWVGSASRWAGLYWVT